MIGPPFMRMVEGKKYLWDGFEYQSLAEAQAAAREYRNEGFEVRSVTEEGHVLLYTRRLVESPELPEGNP